MTVPESHDCCGIGYPLVNSRRGCRVQFGFTLGDVPCLRWPGKARISPRGRLPTGATNGKTTTGRDARWSTVCSRRKLRPEDHESFRLSYSGPRVKKKIIMSMGIRAIAEVSQWSRYPSWSACTMMRRFSLSAPLSRRIRAGSRVILIPYRL
jgi:hypothetical protein